MRSWTDQAGYPLVHVETNNDGSLSITQVYINKLILNRLQIN